MKPSSFLERVFQLSEYFNIRPSEIIHVRNPFQAIIIDFIIYGFYKKDEQEHDLKYKQNILKKIDELRHART